MENNSTPNFVGYLPSMAIEKAKVRRAETKIFLAVNFLINFSIIMENKAQERA